MGLICLDCKCFYTIMAVPDYSEVTAGNDFTMGCNAEFIDEKTGNKKFGHWELDPYKDDENKLREYMKKARTCNEFGLRSKGGK